MGNRLVQICLAILKKNLMFAAMHHDLGKIGFPGDGNEVYQVETSDWHRKNQNKMLYNTMKIFHFTMVPDLIYLVVTRTWC
jgi:hypothetical protein